MKAKDYLEKYRNEFRIRPLKQKVVTEIKEKINSEKDFLYRSINRNISQTNQKNDLKIIGITGSKGKSTVCYLLHNALKLKGKKSVLYSSIEIDSDLSYNLKGAVENPLKDKQMLLNAVNEAIQANAQYLILEVNERAINNKVINDLDFDYKVVTNISPNHNNYLFKDYKNIKKSFVLENNTKDTNIILTVTNPETVDLYNRLDNCTIFTTNFMVERYNLVNKPIKYLLKENENELDTIEGLDFDVYCENKKNKF